MCSPIAVQPSSVTQPGGPKTTIPIRVTSIRELSPFELPGSSLSAV